MIGTIRPSRKYMTKDLLKEYKKYYCGLCTGMERCAGRLARFFVNYDLCFAYILADAVSMADDENKGRCPFNPFRKVVYKDNGELLDYIAKLNYMLTYHKFLDDIVDDGNLIAKIVTRCMKKKYEVISADSPKHEQCITDRLKQLSEIEKSNERKTILEAVQPFGLMLEELTGTIYKNEIDSEIYAKIMYWTGIWIFVVDACLDYSKDMKKKKYNPIIVGMVGEEKSIIKERREEILDLLMHCKNSILDLIELLTLHKNKELIVSIVEHDLPEEVATLLKGEMK